MTEISKASIDEAQARLDEYGGLPFEDTSLKWIDESDLDDLEIPEIYCDKCKHTVAGAGSVEQPCRVGSCIELHCAQCGYNWGGWGPVGCPCQSRDPKTRHIRQLYRARRR